MPTLEEMRDFIQLRDMNFPRRSRVKEKDLIEFLYYRKKAEEIMARYRGNRMGAAAEGYADCGCGFARLSL